MYRGLSEEAGVMGGGLWCPLTGSRCVASQAPAAPAVAAAVPAVATALLVVLVVAICTVYMYVWVSKVK